MESAGEIYRLIPKVMQDVGAIAKGRKNQQQGYAFRGIDDVYNAMQGPLSRHGVFFVPEVLERSVVERTTKAGGALFYTTLKVKFTLYAADGSHVEAVTIGEAMDSGDKSSNKAQSAALKYAMLEIFCIATEAQEDADAATHEVAAESDYFREEVREALEARLFKPAEIKAAVVAITAGYGVRDLLELSDDKRDQVMSSIKAGKADKFKAAETAAV
jgi:hypothetical protein